MPRLRFRLAWRRMNARMKMVRPTSPRIRLRMQRMMRVVGCDELDIEVSGGVMAVAVRVVVVVTAEEDLNAVLDVGMVKRIELLLEVAVVTLVK